MHSTKRPADPAGSGLVYRQSAWTRVTHWLWAVALLFMTMSGLQIFNAHPILYVGEQSGFGDKQYLGSQAGHGNRQFDNSVLDIHVERRGDALVGVTTVLGRDFDTTGFLGLSGSDERPIFRAFPAWATIPSYYDLATARVIHLFFAWILVATWCVWFVASLVNGHFWRDIVPKPRDLRRLPRDVADHLRLRFAHGRRYNVLQQLSYALVLLVVIPAMILTGLTMSPGVEAPWPWLLDLFGGRQTARLLHFIGMLLLLVFFVVHIVMVFAAGPVNEMRSIVTGWFRTSPARGEED